MRPFTRKRSRLGFRDDLSQGALSGEVLIAVNFERLRPPRVFLELSRDGERWEVVGEAAEPPFVLTWDTTRSPDGPAFIRLIAHDGGQHLSAPLRVELENAPSQPRLVDPGRYLAGKVTLRAECHAGARPVFEIVRAGGASWRSVRDAAGGHEVELDTRFMADGAYDLRVEVFSPGGQVSRSSIREVIVDNSPPRVLFASPEPGDRITEEIEVELTVSDGASGVELVVLEYGSAESWQAIASIAPKSEVVRVPWQVAIEDEDEEVDLRARARDHAGNESEQVVPVTLVPAPAKPEPELSEHEAALREVEALPEKAPEPEPKDAAEPWSGSPPMLDNGDVGKPPTPVSALNIWELARLVDATPGQPEDLRLERRQILFLLRQHASVDGTIPDRFGGLIADVFGDLLSRRL